MADNTAIEWTDATWNPVVGCTIVSPGCTNCYAMREAHRLGQNPKLHSKYAGLTKVVNGNPVWTGEARLHEAALLQPLTWKKPRRIFVNSMSDLFHPSLDPVDVAVIYGHAIAAVHLRGHTLQILTKRSDHMRDLLNREEFWDIANSTAESIVLEKVDPLNRRSDDARATLDDYGADKPPPSIWLGVSAEDQARADERIPDLLATPAAVRFVSAEPLLGALDLAPHIPLPRSGERLGEGVAGDRASHPHPASPSIEGEEHEARIDWVIAGGESGPSARPAHPDWIRGLRDQCVSANVPFFFKQWGEWLPTGGEDGWYETHPVSLPLCAWDGGGWTDDPLIDGEWMARIGKKAAGAKLDGRTWREFPAGSAALRAAQASLPGEAGEVAASARTEGS